MKNKFYSQAGQDRLLYGSFFKNKIGGVFIEIGAGNGVDLSNTYFFEKEMRWTGICVEPRHSAFIELVKNRKCHCENICISEKDGEVEFWEFKGEAGQLYSGIRDKYDQRHIESMRKTSFIEFDDKNTVPKKSMTFESLCRKYDIKHIDYCSIDTEGGESEIFESLSNYASIDVLSIENNFSDKKIRKFFRSRGYCFLGRSGNDDLFAIRKLKFLTKIISVRKTTLIDQYCPTQIKEIYQKIKRVILSKDRYKR